jgi:hypothetical protein
MGRWRRRSSSEAAAATKKRPAALAGCGHGRVRQEEDEGQLLGEVGGRARGGHPGNAPRELAPEPGTRRHGQQGLQRAKRHASQSS